MGDFSPRRIQLNTLLDYDSGRRGRVKLTLPRVSILEREECKAERVLTAGDAHRARLPVGSKDARVVDHYDGKLIEKRIKPPRERVPSSKAILAEFIRVLQSRKWDDFVTVRDVLAEAPRDLIDLKSRPEAWFSTVAQALKSTGYVRRACASAKVKAWTKHPAYIEMSGRQIGPILRKWRAGRAGKVPTNGHDYYR